MLINKKEVSLDDAVNFADYENLLLKRRENNLLLSDYQVSILNKYGINYMNYSSVKSLLFEIENILDEDFDEELDLLSSQLSEFIYYNDTKK